METNKAHWENVYATKQPAEVSWTQDVPITSLSFIQSFHLPKTAQIIDIGGGDSRLADYLLAEGFENITVLDISSNALNRARQRLGDKAGKITWLAQDIKTFIPTETYDVWHDRAAFHFLTAEEDIQAYISTATGCIAPGGYAVMGTFSTDGPEKCSGLPVQRYSEELLQNRFTGFTKVQCLLQQHTTPFATQQTFLFCSLKRQ